MCDLAPLTPMDTGLLEPRIAMLTTPLSELLSVFLDLITARMNEEQQDQEREKALEAECKAQEERQLAEEAERKRQAEEEAKQAEAARLAVPAFWDCALCTYINPQAVTTCAMCQSPNPTQQPSRKKVKLSPKGERDQVITPDQKTESEPEEAALAPVSPNLLLYHQLRSRVLKVLSLFLGHPPTLEVLLKAGLLPALLNMAVCPTRLEQFASTERLEATEDRLLELLRQSARGLQEDAVL